MGCGGGECDALEQWSGKGRVKKATGVAGGRAMIDSLRERSFVVSVTGPSVMPQCARDAGAGRGA